MSNTKGRRAAALGLALLVAACGSGAVGDAAIQFGQAFAAAFRAGETATPVEPGVITFLRVTGENPTAEPIEI
jgi:hypothetical protein